MHLYSMLKQWDDRQSETKRLGALWLISQTQKQTFLLYKLNIIDFFSYSSKLEKIEKIEKKKALPLTLVEYVWLH